MAFFKQITEKYETDRDAICLLEYVIKNSYCWNALGMLCGNIEVLWAQIKYYKRYYGKDNRNLLNHYVLSFDTCHYEKDVEFHTILMCANMLSRYFYEYQPIWGIHLHDTHYHIHIVTNTINVRNGKRYHAGKGEFKNFLLWLANELKDYHIALLGVTYYDERGHLKYGDVPSNYLYENKNPFEYSMNEGKRI